VSRGAESAPFQGPGGKGQGQDRTQKQQQRVQGPAHAGTPSSASSEVIVLAENFDLAQRPLGHGRGLDGP
jgi:hypothetical protein